MRHNFITTHRDAEGRPLFAVLWEFTDLRSVDLCEDAGKEDRFNGLWWDAHFTFAGFDVADYPNIEAVVNRIYAAMRNRENTEELMEVLRDEVCKKEELRKKFLPDFLIEKDDVNWKKVKELTEKNNSSDTSTMWRRVIEQLGRELPRPVVLSDNSHRYLFHSLCALVKHRVDNSEVKLKQLPNTQDVVYQEMGERNYNLLLDMHHKSNTYSAVCSADDLQGTFAISDANQNIKALCLA